MIPIKLVNEFYDTEVVEVEFSLFYDCNLNCDFCLQTPFKKDDNIIRLPSNWLENAITRFKNSIDFYHCKRVRISMYGGELFQDKFTDDHIKKYYVFMDSIIEYMKSKHYEYSFELVTNLVYNKIDRMISFIKNYNCSVGTSFDFVGRFNKPYHFQLWKRNIEYLQSHNIDFGVIIIGHKQNLVALQNDKYDIGFFANTNANVDIAEYDDVTNNDSFKPTTEQFVEFVKLLKQKYPNINLSIKGDGVKCGSKVLDISSNHTILQRCDENKLTEMIINKFNCITCEYKKKCIIVCPRKFLQNTYCPNKQLYQQL